MTNKNDPVASLSNFFHVLGHKIRLRLVMELQHQEVNVTELCRRLKNQQSVVSHHLRILRLGSVVSARRSGKEIYYSLNDQYSEQYISSLNALILSVNTAVLDLKLAQ